MTNPLSIGKNTSVNKRYATLKGFFEHHGFIADIPKNYLHYADKMAKLIGGHVEQPAATPEECIAKSLTYEYILVGCNVTCTIPAMTKEGYFIIQGQTKVVLIQEVKLKACMMLVNGKDKKPCCKFLVGQATVPIIVRIQDDAVVELDTSAIQDNIRGIKSIGMYEVISDMYDDRELAIQCVSSMLYSYCPEHASACLVYILSSTRGEGNLLTDEDIQTVKQKIFGNMSNNCIVATLVIMTAACVKNLLMLEQLSDRDHYSMKCLKTPGETIYESFKRCVDMHKNQKDLRNKIENNVVNFIKRGDQQIGEKRYSKMSMQLSKRSYIDALSSVRKVVIPCNENSPSMDMRQIHPSQKGFICPCETPEGKTVGITKSLACCCIISTKTNIDEWVKEACKDTIFENSIWAIVDGAVAGWCTHDNVLSIKSIYPTVSVTMPMSNIAVIRTSSGRPLRPLFVVKDHPIDWNIIGTFRQMLSLGQLEYLDPTECENSIIASVGYEGNWKKFTHMEIHPCSMLGLAASMIPFSEHNQSARNVFSSSMVKQAMQMHGSEKTCYYLQKPLVQTEIARNIGMNSNPNGVNLVTCIMSINGYNQEDAIIVKKSSIDAGLFSYVARNTSTVVVNNPWSIVGGSKSKSGHFELRIMHGGIERAIVEVRSMMKNPKITAIKEYFVENGRSKIDITMEENRKLSMGDKLASRHAQKGVVGLIMKDEDMPFCSSSGMIPDIIINPHAIPSRMTVGQLLEGVIGKHCAMSGTFADGTPFLRKDKKDLCEIVNMSDTEQMILGTTGELVRTPVAIGMVYYMAMKHQAADKIYVRSTGPNSIMSRQPMSGRSKGGGLRFGEMEYDCLIAHGASELVTEVSRNSDMASTPYCKNCCIVTDIFNSPCRLCGNKTVTVQMPFSYAVLKDLLLAANIKIQTKLNS